MKPSTLWLAVIVLLRVFAAAPLQAETGSLTLRVEVRSVSPVAGEPAQLHRILVGLPAVSLSSARGKADVERRLARAADAVSAAGCRFQVIRARSVCNLLARIEDDTLMIDLGELDAVPTAAAAAQNFTVAFEYSEAPSVVLQKLTVETSTDSVGGSNATEESLVELTHSEALQRLNRSPAAALDGVSIQLRYTQADRSRGARTQPFAQRRIEDALIDAALRALDPV